MDCIHAYTKQKIPYVLCDKENVPTGYDRRELFHAVCIHQTHCPKQNCHKLTPEWRSCLKLVSEANQSAQESAGVAFVAEAHTDSETPKTPQKRSRKPKTED